MARFKVKHLTAGNDGQILTTSGTAVVWLDNAGGGGGGGSGESGWSGWSGAGALGIQERQIEVFYANTTHARPVEIKVGKDNVLSFVTGTDNSVDFSMEIPGDLDVTDDIQVGLAYHMASSSVGVVRLVLEYEVIDMGADTAPSSPTGTLTATIDPPEITSRERAYHDFTIPASAISATTEAIRFRLRRDTSVGSNHPAAFNLEDVVIRYTGFGAPVQNSGTSGFSGTGTWFDRYTLVSSTNDYNPTPTSTSTIATNFDLRPIIKVGFPIRWKTAGTYYYGIVTAITAAQITIAGAPLVTGSASIQELTYGTPELLQVSSENFFVAGRFADNASNQLIQDDMRTFIRWNQPAGKLVKILVRAHTPDSGALQPRVNVRINGNPVATANANAGLDLPTSATWAETVVNINTSNYAIAYGDTIEISTDATGSNGDAENLTVGCVFVLE
jgi:hypothetical protein